MRGCHQKLKDKNIKEVLDEDFKLEYNHARITAAKLGYNSYYVGFSLANRLYDFRFLQNMHFKTHSMNGI